MVTSRLAPPARGVASIANLVNAAVPRAVIDLFHRFVVDAVIVSFPKTGYTWLSSMLRQIIVDAYGRPTADLGKVFVHDHRPSQVLSLPHGIPLIYHNHFITKAPAPPHLENMIAWLTPFRHKPMLVLFRDVKDVLVSYYMETVFREERPYFTGTVDEFVMSDNYGAKKFVLYHNALAQFRRTSRAPLLITHYEDLWSDTAETLKRTALFLGIGNTTDATINRAVETWSLTNMRRMEETATPETALVPDLHVPVSGRDEGRRARIGGSGNWRRHLSAEVAAWADDYVAQNIDPLFHRLGRHPEDRAPRG